MATVLELWLVRHGATAWSRNGRHTGRSDLPLLLEGEEEAQLLAPVLAGQGIAGVLVSPLKRAQRTAELAGLGGLAQVCPNLCEWDYGAYEGITTATIRETIPNWTIWSHGCPEGETSAAVEERCRRVLAQAQAMALKAPGRSPKIVLVAHGHILRSLAGTWLGLGVQGGALLTLATATLSVLGYEREQPVILRWNVPIQTRA